MADFYKHQLFIRVYHRNQHRLKDRNDNRLKAEVLYVRIQIKIKHTTRCPGGGRSGSGICHAPCDSG
jgi:hypothetical protein